MSSRVECVGQGGGARAGAGRSVRAISRSNKIKPNVQSELSASLLCFMQQHSLSGGGTALLPVHRPAEFGEPLGGMATVDLGLSTHWPRF